jgi:hypothetical protein
VRFVWLIVWLIAIFEKVVIDFAEEIVGSVEVFIEAAEVFDRPKGRIE